MDSLKAFNDALGRLSGGNKSLPYFGGENLGFVDLMFAPLIPWFPALEIVGDFKFPVFEDKYPHLHNWLSAFKKSSIASVLPKAENVTEYGVPALRRREAAS
jgi:glutathione S-transferase